MGGVHGGTVGESNCEAMQGGLLVDAGCRRAKEMTSATGIGNCFSRHRNRRRESEGI